MRNKILEILEPLRTTKCPICHGATKKADNISYVGGGVVHICTDTACSASAPLSNCSV